MRRDEDQPEEHRTDRDEERTDREEDPTDRDEECTDQGDRGPDLRGEAWRRVVLGLADAVGPLLITLLGWWLPPHP
ncbi:hypothetical protein ACFY7C_06735 [Streptomyces sp. NPDC012769]|uniref:hypothetical protein n=1 Tax=Streptomyces sp. NPDC012769 TaxID=3364848 RepID=UPI0036BCB39C